jgi:hypothetical protein
VVRFGLVEFAMGSGEEAFEGRPVGARVATPGEDVDGVTVGGVNALKGDGEDLLVRKGL